MKNIFFLLHITLLSCFFSIQSIKAQNHKILIIDENNNEIPYLCLKSLRTNKYILSDSKGFIILREEQFNTSDTLQVESLFFENLKIEIKDLQKMNKLLLSNRNITMDEVSVYSSRSIQDILKKSSYNFAKKYAKNYCAQMLHLRTVETNGKYRELCGYQGIFASFNFTQKPVGFFWEDKNKMYAAPLTVMRSDPLMDNGYNRVNPHSVYTKGDIRSKYGLKTQYHNNAYHRLLDYKRSIEMYTPLNDRQLNHFNYTISDEYENTLNQKIIVIRFETKAEAYPRKTLIFGSGYLYYNTELEYAERIVMENHQDQYVMFPRWRTDTLVNSATKHLLDIVYCMQDDHIYTQNVSLDVQWVDPNIEENFYYIKINSRRNPLKYNLHEYETVTFSKFVLLDKEKKKSIAPLLPYPIEANNLIYIAAFNQSVWNKTALPGLDRAKIFKDLSYSNRSFYLQAQENALDIDYYYKVTEPWRRNSILHYYIQTKEKLYPLLYNEKYQ